tara:strand:- start:91 stop:579 length:489 start_codon:yes stop_codon:yes gene_type:complete
VSRLDSFIRRMQAQRDCLNAAARMIADIPGSVFDLGLGNGRTFDHLRETLPDREVFVFDRVVNANPKSTPDAERLFLGEVVDQLVVQQDRFVGAVALVHSDLGTGTAEDAPLTAALIPLLRPLLVTGAVLVANNPFPDAGWELLPLPDGVPAERYFMYRVTA